MPTCRKCDEKKTLAEFDPDPARALGHDPYCTSCRRAYTAQWRERHRERYNAQRRAHYHLSIAQAAAQAEPPGRDSYTRRKRKSRRDMAWHRAHRPYWRAYKKVWEHRTRTRRRMAQRAHPPLKRAPRPFANLPSPAAEISFVPASRTQEAAYLIFLVDAPRTTVLHRSATRSEAEAWATDHGYTIV